MPASTPIQSAALHILVRKAESLIPLYPKRFSDIEAVKIYISNLSNLDPTNPLDDKVAFLIAIHAFQDGEFYLDTAPPDRRVLRNAIETSISTLLAQIPTWPSTLPSVSHAQSYITNHCGDTMHALSFPTLPAAKFQSYVSFNAARRAWEARAFNLRVVPGAWRRKSLLSPDSLSAAIQRDIERLTPLLPAWPERFADLNAARDWVRAVAEKRRFRYTGWEGVEGMGFRCFVQFNLAKGEWGRGVFGVDEMRARGGGKGGVGEQSARITGVRPNFRTEDGGGGVLCEEEVEEERFTVSTAPYGLGFREFKSRAVVGFVADDDKENEAPLSPADSMEPLATIEEVDEGVEEGAEEDGVVDEGEREKPDPFAALVADLRREFILKAAFD